MTLFRTVQPIPGESLPGLIARAAADNVYPSAYDVLAQAGLDRFYPQGIARRDPAIAVALGGVLGTDPDNLAPMFHRSVDARRIDFFGMVLRDIHREPTIRRVSPRALRISPHMRAIWHVRPISFDPGTGERLLSSCPVCNRNLGFSRTNGVAFCDFCIAADEDGLPRPGVDLRDFPQPLIEVEDAEAVAFVTGLVDPDPVVRGRFAPQLHDELAGLDRGDLFEMALAIAAALTVNERPIAESVTGLRWRSKVTEPDVAKLEAAGRALLSWPEGLARLCEAATANAAARPGQWNIAKEVGALANLPKDEFLSERARNAMKTAIAGYFTTSRLDRVRRVGLRDPDVYIGAKELQRATGLRADTIAKLAERPDVYVRRAGPAPAPLVFSTLQMEWLVRDYRDLVPESRLVLEFGIPNDAVRDLAAMLYIQDEKPGVATDILAPGTYYRNQTVQNLLDTIYDGIPLRRDRQGSIAFIEAMLMFPAGRRPWVPLLEAIFFGRVEASFHKQPTKGLITGLSVKGVEAQRARILDDLKLLPDPKVDRVTTGAANLMLGIYNYPAFTALVAAGLLTLNDDGTVPYDGVIQLARRFIFANEAGVRSGGGTATAPAWLEAWGVRPAHDLGVKGGVLFERERVEPLLEMKAGCV